MASFPGAKAHRVSRRKLGRNQAIQVPAAVITLSVATGGASLLSISLSTPCCILGVIPLFISNGVGSSSLQTIVNNTLVLQSFGDGYSSLDLATLAAGVPQIRTFQGGLNAAFSGPA
jgi:hypothetical protein